MSFAATSRAVVSPGSPGPVVTITRTGPRIGLRRAYREKPHATAPPGHRRTCRRITAIARFVAPNREPQNPA